MNTRTVNPFNALEARLDQVAQFFSTLTPASLARLPEFYAADARFVDPFNDVRGPAAIAGLFQEMFHKLDAPRFVVTGRYFCATNDRRAMLAWSMHFSSALLGGPRVIIGVSELVFDPSGLIVEHRDHWDASSQLLAHLPLFGVALRAVLRRMAARPQT